MSCRWVKRWQVRPLQPAKMDLDFHTSDRGRGSSDYLTGLLYGLSSENIETNLETGSLNSTHLNRRRTFLGSSIFRPGNLGNPSDWVLEGDRSSGAKRMKDMIRRISQNSFNNWNWWNKMTTQSQGTHQRTMGFFSKKIILLKDCPVNDRVHQQ